MLRTQIREEIFRMIFRIPFHTSEEMDWQIDFFMEELEGKSEKNQKYIRNKVMDIITHLPEIDEQISVNCEGWNLNRIGKAEIAIMRIAVYEMLYEKELLTSISINEAVELSKVYCEEDAKGFVNAVLGKVAKSME